MDASALLLALLASRSPQGGGTVLYTLVGDAPGSRFGAALAAVGDVDGDGHIDYAVGAPRARAGGLERGAVRMVSGASGGTLWQARGDEAGGGFGAALAGVGDIDGDGCPDLLIGAPLAGGSGKVLLVSGSDGRTLRLLTGSAAGERFGAALAGVGDADGDGCPDFAVGAPQAGAGGPLAGAASLHSGRSGQLLWRREGAAFDLLGSALSAAGDLDGDGRADLWIGAPLSDRGAFNAGSALACSGRDGRILLAVHGGEAGAQLGAGLCGGFDLDGDGVPDLVLTAPGMDAAGIDSGAVELRSGRTGALLWRQSGSAAGELLGSVAVVADVDGDGRPEVAAGAAAASLAGPEAGSVRLLSGRDGTELARWLGRSPGDWLGASLAAVSAPGGALRPELAAGAPGRSDQPLKPGYVQLLRPP